MRELTARERVQNAIERKPVDRLPVCEGFWAETIRRWTDEGHLQEGEDLVAHFDHDVRRAGGINGIADLDFEPAVLEETAETILRLDGNGAKLRRHKLHSTTPEHVDFTVKEQRGWEESIKPHLLEVDRRRIPFETYREERRKATEEERHFCWAGLAPFEQMHPMCGHEYMLLGMAADPQWVVDMVATYAEFTIMHLEVLFAAEGLPDSIWFYEDMGFKKKPFMSPAMYRDIMQPGHRRLFGYAHALGRMVIVHSCGFVEPLVEGLIAAGMDCLQAMEVKAGMDMPRLCQRYGERISFCGNIDVRELVSNDHGRIRAELERKIPLVLKSGGGYMLHSDHSIPPDVDYDTYCFFLERGRALGRRAPV
ncbi:MAG: uroporphyrinogen decarboxylase family protein [Candidatus Latescibacteria bacterium]|nr:uroporphyrinogen decarboxylase family protein [Candidatus Latescibacterota bacterium]